MRTCTCVQLGSITKYSTVPRMQDRCDLHHSQKTGQQVIAEGRGLANGTHPMDAINRAAVYGLLQHLIIVHLLRHHSGPAKIWLHLVCSRAHTSAVLTTNACQLVNKHLQDSGA